MIQLERGLRLNLINYLFPSMQYIIEPPCKSWFFMYVGRTFAAALAAATRSSVVAPGCSAIICNRCASASNLYAGSFFIVLKINSVEAAAFRSRGDTLPCTSKHFYAKHAQRPEETPQHTKIKQQLPIEELHLLLGTYLS